MNVYDFDGTIYAGDSTIDFWLYCVKKYPKTLLALPNAVVKAVLYKMGRISTEKFKESFYQFLPLIPALQDEVSQFWDEHIERIQAWYLDQKQAEDLVISASPEFLLAECCKRLNVRLLASQVDPETGSLWGKNCKGAEKVRRFREVYSEQTVVTFYTDSESDRPMAELASRSYLVRGNVCTEWEVRRES